jgi:flagellar biosynthetic protein FliP
MTIDARFVVRGAASILMLTSGSALAADPIQDLVSQLTVQDYAPALKIFLFLTALSFVPLMLIAMTAFTRIVIVLSLLRHALGMPQTPPNSILVTLGVFLTLFAMSPVLERVYDDAVSPYMDKQIDTRAALDKGILPLKEFMVRQTREKDLLAVIKMAKSPPPQTLDDIQLRHLLPAFMLSELRTAFQIGFVVFLPFLLIDVVVAAILMALGMIMVPPVTISLPLKILVFLLVDGWLLIGEALLGSFRI